MGEGGRGLTIIGIVGLHPWMEGHLRQTLQHQANKYARKYVLGLDKEPQNRK